MKIILLTFSLACWLAGCGGGITDYRKEIAPGWVIVRSNLYDKVITNDGGPYLYSTTEKLGPLYQYAFRNYFIYAKHYGGKKRNAFEGDTYIDIDRSKTFYIIIDKRTGRVQGPLDSIDETELNWHRA